MRPTFTAKQLSRFADSFWRRVRRDGPIPPHDPALGECWIWLDTTGCDSPRGKFYRNCAGAYRGIISARGAMLLTQGFLTPGLCVLHKCDNDKCVRPSHLYEGTKQQNAVDRVQRCRQPHTRQFIELHGHPFLPLRHLVD